VAVDGKSKHTSNQSNYKIKNVYKTLLNNSSISLRTCYSGGCRGNSFWLIHSFIWSARSIYIGYIHCLDRSTHMMENTYIYCLDLTLVWRWQRRMRSVCARGRAMAATEETVSSGIDDGGEDRRSRERRGLREFCDE
jgi:hypothetical protein